MVATGQCPLLARQADAQNQNRFKTVSQREMCNVKTISHITVSYLLLVGVSCPRRAWRSILHKDLNIVCILQNSQKTDVGPCK